MYPAYPAEKPGAFGLSLGRVCRGHSDITPDRQRPKYYRKWTKPEEIVETLRHSEKMKKVIKVSINKIPLRWQEDAYNVLKVYLDHLRRYYAGKEGGLEIVDGIEERIAELLGERQMGARVVSKADVDQVLEIMGPPEVIEEEGGEPSPEMPGWKPFSQTGQTIVPRCWTTKSWRCLFRTCRLFQYK